MKLFHPDPSQAYLGAWLWVPKTFIDPRHLRDSLMLTSSDENKVRVTQLYRETATHILVPREFWRYDSLPYDIVDRRPSSYPLVEVTSKVVLDALKPEEDTQRRAMSALLAGRGGILQLACGKGKSVLAIDFITRKKVPAIIMADNTFLLNQWREEILRFTNLTPADIGQIQGDKMDWEKPIVLATYQTLAMRAATMPEHVRRHFGIAIWDEGHHLAAETFSRTATLFYGYRLLLTATPTRSDGMHLIYNFHVGDVIYKDLIPDMKTLVQFQWTGMKLDFEDAKVLEKTHDRNGELHLKMLAGHLGRQREHLETVLGLVRKFRQDGRRVLVLSESVAELVNLLGLWKGVPYGSLYSDIKPTDAKVSYEPRRLEAHQLAKVHARIQQLKIALKDTSLSERERGHITTQLLPDQYEKISAHELAVTQDNEVSRMQRGYIKDLLSVDGDAGILTQKVSPEERDKMLERYPVNFAIMKYGKEGLNSRHLDTVIMTMPVSDRNILQQILGRPSRLLAGKKTPIVLVLEHEIGPIIGMCRKMRAYLNVWPRDEGGPYEYQELGNPKLNALRKKNPL